MLDIQECGRRRISQSLPKRQCIDAPLVSLNCWQHDKLLVSLCRSATVCSHCSPKITTDTSLALSGQHQPITLPGNREPRSLRALDFRNNSSESSKNVLIVSLPLASVHIFLVYDISGCFCKTSLVTSQPISSVR